MKQDMKARMARAASVAAAIEKGKARKKHEPWINLSNPGQTKYQWEQEQRAKFKYYGPIPEDTK